MVILICMALVQSTACDHKFLPFLKFPKSANQKSENSFRFERFCSVYVQYGISFIRLVELSQMALLFPATLFSGGIRGAQPTTGVTPKLLGLFCACPTPRSQGIPHAQGFGNRT
jgi:hypothetical protein